LVAGCTANYPQGPTPTPTLAGLQLHYSQPLDYLVPGGVARLILYAINSEGVYEDVSTRASWFSGNGGIVLPTANGNVRAVADGTADVIATYQGLTTTAPIVVSRFEQALNVSIPFIEAGETRQATARQRNIGNTDVTSRSTWTSSNPAIVTVDTGKITAHAPGTASITVRFETFGLATVYLSVPPIRSLP
jgi:uncharacterized protein YjdB